jgi:predicted ester cyclase
MSRQKALLRGMAEALAAGDADHVAEWFTEDFALHDQAFGGALHGHDGARQMLARLAEMLPGTRIAILDMVEEEDRVAVRWLFEAGEPGQATQVSVLAIYRFVDGRIAEDWGAAAPGEWP